MNQHNLYNTDTEPVVTLPLNTVDELHRALAQTGYIAADQVAMALFLAHKLNKPLLVEGPPGVGKTELAKAAAAIFSRPLLRLQCYQGLDESKALYEWKYGKQLLYSQILKQQLDQITGSDGKLSTAIERLHALDDIFFCEQFIAPRPLLQALQHPDGAVLLIDEVDKSDEAFEALLLEVLSDYQITIPELGTICAQSIPLVILTSNQQRELGDALKRRCLHLAIPLPTPEHELSILRHQLPAIPEQLARQMTEFVSHLRTLTLLKQPAISETLDWARALHLLHIQQLTPEQIEPTLNLLLKQQADIEYVTTQLPAALPKQQG